ncbi:MAG TPA: DUF6770 family protein [Flavobacterium sp.]|nr:DUF6770 family protein [Flavobacterium sp.]
MKLKFVFTGLFGLFSLSVTNAQSLTVSEVDYLNHRDIGTVTINGNRSHYMFHLNTKKLENKQSEGVITFLDGDLSVLKKETFILGKDDTFLDIKNNGNRIIASFHNIPKETTTLRVYSDKGELVKTKELKVPKEVFAPQFYKWAEKIADLSLVYPITNKGFLFTEVARKKRIGYNFHFLADDESKNWVYESPKDHNNKKTAAPLFANDDIVVIMEKEWGSVYDKQPTFKAIVLDANTGKELFSTGHAYETVPNFYTKAFVNQEGEIILFGETYELNNNYPDNDYNNGYFIEKYSRTGESLGQNKVSFKDFNFKKTLGFSPETKPKEMGTIFFYSLAASEGKYYAIGETARREKQGFTIAKGLLVTSIGTFSSTNWQSKYTMENMIVLEFDENMKHTATHKLPKESTLTGLNSIVVRPYFNLTEMEYDGKLDYLFQTTNNHRLESAFYLDQKAEAGKTTGIIKKARLENDKFTVSDFITFSTDNKEGDFYVLPADNNSILLIKYDQTKKSAKLEILKGS